MSKHQTQLGRVRWASRRGKGEPNPPRETKNSGANGGRNWRKEVYVENIGGEVLSIDQNLLKKIQILIVVPALGGLNEDTLCDKEQVTQQQRTWRKYMRKQRLHLMSARFCKTNTVNDSSFWRY